MPRQNEKMCLRKKIFWSEFDAKSRLLRLNRRGVHMRAYHCPNCHQWHLTSQA